MMNYASLPNPDNIRRRILSNGICVLLKENDQSSSVSVRGVFPAGGYLDPQGCAGLAKMTALCLTMGNERRDFAAINELLDGIAASLLFSAGIRSTRFDAHSLAEDLPVMLELIRDSITAPVFPDELLDIVRRQAVTAYEIRQHDPDSMADQIFNRAIYPNHPYGRPEFESLEALLGQTREDLAGFAARYYRPERMVISVCGGVNAERTFDLLEQTLGSWDPGKLPVDPDEAFLKLDDYVPDRIHYEIPEKSEMALIVGVRGPKSDDPLREAAKVGNCILGEFGMMGRIGHSVREENGLAYSADSTLSSNLYGGDWSVGAGVSPQNTQKALGLIIAELKRFASEEVSDEELEDVKSCLIGGMPLGLSSNEAVSAALISMELLHRGSDYFVRYPDMIRGVSKADILEAARKYWDPERMVVVTAGTAV